jgi:hypothetical protein
VLVEALGQLLGAAAYDNAVRPPAESAVLEAVVEVAAAEQGVLRRLLAELGVPEKASRVLRTLTLRRELVRGKLPPSICPAVALWQASQVPMYVLTLYVLTTACGPPAGPDGGIRSRCFLNGSPTSGMVTLHSCCIATMQFAC